jgi:glycosyltransferase involved in cell wall biosynthesis
MAEFIPDRTEVFLVVDKDVLSRLGSAVRHLCVGLMDEPVNVTVLSPTPDDGVEELVAPWPVIRPAQPVWPWKKPSAEGLLDEFELDPPQVIHCFSPGLAEWVCQWCHDWGAKIVVHALDLQDVAELALLRLPLDSRVVAGFPKVESALLQKRPDLGAAIRVIPLGVPAAEEPACLDEPERIPAVIVTAPLVKNSGIDHLLESLAAVVKRGQETQLFLLSRGPAEGALRQQVDRLGLRSNVTFAGPMPDWISLNEAMQGADYFVMPCVPRRYSLSSLAALANGLAVIAPKGALEDYLVDGVSARLFDPSKPGDFQEKWTPLLHDPQAARKLACSALDYVRGRHQASAMITSLAGLYRELAFIPAAERSTGG